MSLSIMFVWERSRALGLQGMNTVAIIVTFQLRRQIMRYGCREKNVFCFESQHEDYTQVEDLKI
jgi:hypothetical protein